MNDIRNRFVVADQEKLDKAMQAAEKKVKPPKVVKYDWTGQARANALCLPVVPHEVVKVADSSKDKLEYSVIGQQVIASRPFVSPVVIEYITEPEYSKWTSAMIDAVALELAK